MGPYTLPGGCRGGAALLMDVIEDLLDCVWFGDRCDDAQPRAAHWTQLNIDFEYPLESLCPGKWREGPVRRDTG